MFRPGSSTGGPPVAAKRGQPNAGSSSSGGGGGGGGGGGNTGAGGLRSNGKSFSWRALNVVDPLNTSNNVGAAASADSVRRFAAALARLSSALSRLPRRNCADAREKQATMKTNTSNDGNGDASLPVDWGSVDGRVTHFDVRLPEAELASASVQLSC